jgi:hypothetical protein
MKSIVNYYKNEQGRKVFCINQAIRDGQYPDPENKNAYVNAVLVDRQTGESCLVLCVSGDESMYFINFDSGGFLCLDHAIEKFAFSN